MPEIQIPIPSGKISFARALVDDEYRMTVAYRADGFEREAPERDPAFIVACGLAFCDTFGPDEFQRSEGRKVATQHLDGSLVVRLYVGQTVLEAVYAALAKRSPRELRALHVPRRLISFFRAMRKRPAFRPNPKRASRHTVSMKARRIYSAAIRNGKCHEDAVAECRAAKARG